MDNKRFYKKISTLFWFLLATLPIWLAVVQTILTYFLHLDNQTSFNSASFQNPNHITNLFGGLFLAYFNNIVPYFRAYVPTFLTTAFDNLFSTFSSSYSFTSNFCAWFVWAYFIELCVDFIAILPKIFHRLLERVCDYL